ncbi:PREDICTED: protein FAR1-RELATED SEQUENCE 5-like [Ipomoea nil]|uniref:protein FAR1-RELATED SEQUENCE 5-like n=1 Tax=Ipomoea nil TaxID=35883 RepID=UPI000900C87C|nr:PREDICTED: protein FAR1-RELATED SEQUENCE 5-like [Ipomoea nil]
MGKFEAMNLELMRNKMAKKEKLGPLRYTEKKNHVVGKSSDPVRREEVGKYLVKEGNLYLSRHTLKVMANMKTFVRSGSIQGCVIDVSPDGTKFWTPSCDEVVRPFEGQLFPSLAHGIVFNRQYGSLFGFDVRCSSVRKNREGVVVKNLLVCSREGFKPGGHGPGVVNGALDQPAVALKCRRVSNIVGCKARMLLKMVDDGVFVVHFIEHRHNHCLCSDVARPFLRVNRSIDVQYQIFMLKCARANVGPNRSFRLAREFAGSYSNVGATCVDFKNLKRDFMAYIGTSDAHVVVKKYAKKVEDCPDYFFKYDLDSEDQLRRVFWADPIAKENYLTFGDVVSFDATYGTNRYGMVLVPFTGVDNHKRGVTFAIGLISREDVDSYVWLLQQFKSAMGCVPSFTISDQDPSMRIAVPQVFGTMRHRFCMWHIMSKVGEKVGNVLSKDEEFRRALNDVVWNETLSVEEFERGWQDVMEKYSLGDHRWFRLMYDLRSYWIPAFFNDLFMGGLLRTTSRSEAVNSVFGSCTNQHNSLSAMFNNFEGAIDAQRATQAKLNAECEGHFPTSETPLLIEKHAAAVYTVNIFYDVQAEVIAGSFSCRSVRSNVDGVVTRYEVQDGDELVHTVIFDSGNIVVECTCNMFTRVELLCRHIFWVFKDRKVVSIPSRYVVSRWTRGACVRQLLGVQRRGSADVDVAIGEAWAEFFSCMIIASRSVDNVMKLTAYLKDFNANLLAENGPNDPSSSSSSKKQLFEVFCGASLDGEVHIRPPPISINKGGGKRFKSSRELAIEKAGRRQRQCQTCEKYGHNSHTCPMRNVNI